MSTARHDHRNGGDLCLWHLIAGDIHHDVRRYRPSWLPIHPGDHRFLRHVRVYNVLDNHGMADATRYPHLGVFHGDRSVLVPGRIRSRGHHLHLCLLSLRVGCGDQPRDCLADRPSGYFRRGEHHLLGVSMAAEYADGGERCPLPHLRADDIHSPAVLCFCARRPQHRGVSLRRAVCLRAGQGRYSAGFHARVSSVSQANGGDGGVSHRGLHA
mmetsp:Transcript_33125/g.104817  ORF Transcript_33125/g.104817 Transcript_33125/m.104817 type:complete len:213 (+) Transcript_33125:251-889(+)